MDSRLLYYDAIDEFHRKFNENLLTAEHVKGGQIKISSLHYPDGDKDEEVNFWGYELEKDGVKYLLSSVHNNKEIDLRDTLPILPTQSQKVATKGIVYRQIMNYQTARIRPEQYFSPKEFLKILTPFKVTNRKHYVLNIMKAIAALMLRYNDRTCSNPGFGKDSAVDLLGNLIGGCETIVSPTYAKLEERAVILKWLAINEVVDISKADWRIIQQYLLDFGAHKPKVTKHSKAHGVVKEVIDAIDFSLSLMYNDIADYPEPKKYFDFVTKAPIKDRFPAFRMYGKYTEDFNSINQVDIKKLVEDNFDFYKKLLSTYEFYKQNLSQYLHGYEREHFLKYGHRWNINLGRLLHIVDLFSDSQEEFNAWCKVIESSLEDYQCMLEYPTLVRNLASKFKISRTDSAEFKKFNYIIEHLEVLDPDKKDKAVQYRIDYCRKVMKADTYIKKKELVNNYKPYENQQSKLEDKKFW